MLQVGKVLFCGEWEAEKVAKVLIISDNNHVFN